MAHATDLNTRYDAAAPRWADKMRLLGYYDAYLGLLSSLNFRAPEGTEVLDIGCGTGAFAEAWVAIQGPRHSVTLLDPSAEMLSLGGAALARRDVASETVRSTLEEFKAEAPFHCLLAAHVLEHADRPVEALRAMRGLVQDDGRLWLVVSKPHWCNAIIWFQWRHRSYRPETVAAMLEESGWALEMEYAFPSGPPSRTSRGYLAHPV